MILIAPVAVIRATARDPNPWVQISMIPQYRPNLTCKILKSMGAIDVFSKIQWVQLHPLHPTSGDPGYCSYDFQTGPTVSENECHNLTR